jgi:DNA-binding transcriptional ArsR family regulator
VTDSGLPPEVELFLDAHIFSVTQLEVLLLAREQAPATAAQLSQIAHVPERSLTPWLDAFVEGGLLSRDEQGDYRPAELDDELAATMGTVADCYARRRVTLSRYVYTSGGDPARRFADAFRFRKDKDKDR